jgi:hypothetical protein
MKELIFLIEESLEGGYEARALEAHIHTEADNLDELKEAIRDAVKCHYNENDMPHIIRLHFIKEEVITL